MRRRLFEMAILVVMSGGIAACEATRDLLIGPTSPPAPAPSPTPALVLTPCSACDLPLPTPSPTPSPRPEGDIPDNDAPVALVDLRVYYYQCDGEVAWDADHSAGIPVGCKVVLDATPKDAGRRPTRTRTLPAWYFGPVDLVRAGHVNHTFTPGFTALGAGQFSVHVVVDGVSSNALTLAFVAR